MVKKILSKTNLILLVILAIATFMRLYKIADYLTFLGDEGRDVLVVYNILHGHFTLLGPTASVGGFFLGPIYYYFMAPFLWLFNYSPVGPAVMIALAGVFTVWLVYKIGSLFFDQTAGIIAALLFAINPLVILYSRSSWNPNLMPLVTLLMLFVLYEAVKKNSWKLYLLTGFLYGIAMQLHYIEVFMGPTMAIYIVLGNIYKPYEKKSWIYLVKILLQQALMTIAGFLVGWSPFLLFEARHGFNNLRAIFNFVFHASSSGDGVGIETNFFGNTADIFHRIFGRLLLYMPSPDMYHNFTSWELQFYSIGAWIVGIGSVAFLIFLLWKNFTKRDKFLQYSLILLWLVIGILFFGFYKKNIYDYYFEFLYPVPFLIFGALCAYLLRKHMFIKLITLASLVTIAAINLWWVPFKYPGNKQLQQTEIISRFVLDKTQGQPFNFALITAGNSDHAYRYFFTVWDRPPVTIQFPGVDPKRTSVTNQLMVVCEEACMPLGNSLWEIAGFGRAEIVGQWNVSVVKVYRLIHYNSK